ncbi:hypothetical protein BDW75DRAFT_163439 [Aspergillus navahoensis]
MNSPRLVPVEERRKGKESLDGRATARRRKRGYEMERWRGGSRPEKRVRKRQSQPCKEDNHLLRARRLS